MSRRARYTFIEVSVHHLPRKGGRATGAKSSVITCACGEMFFCAYGAKHPRLFFIVGRLPDDKAAQGWLDSHYHFVAQIVTRTVTIRLYLIGAT